MDIRESPWPDPIVPAGRALEDAHEQWHDAFEHYHDPARFRRHVESTIQSLRNVTWRLQKQKGLLGGEFDSWYKQWQLYLGGSDELRWLNEARVEIVKKDGLHTSSHALIQVYDSYLQPSRTIMELPAHWATNRLFDHVRKQIPHRARQYVAIGIARRWQVPAFDSRELLSVLSWCWHVIEALLLYAEEIQEGSIAGSPADYVASVERPACMLVDPSLNRQLLAADSGARLGYKARPVPDGGSISAEAERRYRRAPRIFKGQSLADRARAAHRLARHLFKKDKHLVSVVFFRDRSASWSTHAFYARDKRDKFILWHDFATQAAIFGYDAYILNSEIWTAPVPDSVPPYYEASKSPNRKEHVTTIYESADGEAGMWSSEIIRVAGRPLLRAANFLIIDPSENTFASPVRDVFNHFRGEQPSSQSKSSRAARHEGSRKGA